jgi:transcriptional regulator with XRE-family HTH domain
MTENFGEKLKLLRSKENLSQEKMAEILNVSRTAVSKWESGRGLPNYDALKGISSYFNVTIDSLLTQEEALAKVDTETKESKRKNLLMLSGLLDCLIILLVVLPLFPLTLDNHIYAAGIFKSDIGTVARSLFLFLFFLSLAIGILQLVLMSFPNKTLVIKNVRIVSFSIGIILMILVIVTPNAYAGLFIFVIEIIKIFFHPFSSLKQQ